MYEVLRCGLKMESQHSIEGPTGHEFSLLWSYSRLKSEVLGDFIEKFAFWKKDTFRGNFQNSVLKGFIATQIHFLCANFVKFGVREVGEIGRCLPHKKKFGSLSRCCFCMDRSQNLPGPAANNVLSVPQIYSKSVHFRRSVPNV